MGEVKKVKGFEHPTCMRCEHDLELIQEEEEFGEKIYQCPYCGVIEHFYPCLEEEQENYGFYNDECEDTLGDCSHGYDGFCPQCGSHIVWGGDFMYTDLFPIDDDEEVELNEYGCPVDDSLVSNVYCPHCGASIDIIEPLPSQRHIYPAFADENNEEEENYN